MTSLLIGSIPTGIILVILAGAIMVLKLYEFRKKGKRSPLTAQLLRSPGETLRRQIDDLSLDIIFYFMIAPVLPLSFYATYLSQLYLDGSKITPITVIIYITVSSALVLYCFVKLWFLFKKRNALRLGLDCELAVAQELNQLMLEGYRVYHDFPADEFNIDHIVVGPKGVFAVETKGRSKPDKKGGSEEATVVYDGESLRFPNWSEKEPFEQAKRQATWLAKWLSSSVGEPVSASPVLVLPGWYIERKKPTDFLIFNGKNPGVMINRKNDNSLSETLINRIVHQLEQRCRNVEPVGFKKGKKK